jgi:hypothetical protein
MGAARGAGSGALVGLPREGRLAMHAVYIVVYRHTPWWGTSAAGVWRGNVVHVVVSRHTPRDRARVAYAAAIALDTTAKVASPRTTAPTPHHPSSMQSKRAATTDNRQTPSRSRARDRRPRR